MKIKLVASAVLLLLTGAGRAQSVPQSVLLPIVRAEDRRDWNASLADLCRDKSPAVRRRALLAAGRIGDARALPIVSDTLAHDPDTQTQAEAAFALGLIASPQSASVLVRVLRNPSTPDTVRARSVEALGKVAQALLPAQKAQKAALREQVYSVLHAEQARPHRLTVLLALTAALRAGPSANTGKAVGAFLLSPDARVRADAENVLARLHVKDPALLPRLRVLLTTDADPDVRASAARALAAASDAASTEALTRRAALDPDGRVRVSAIRALGVLKAKASVPALLARARVLQAQYNRDRAHGVAHPVAVNELLEIAASLGDTVAGTENADALAFVNSLRDGERHEAPELEIAAAQIAPAAYMAERPVLTDWRAFSARAQGLAALPAGLSSDAADAGTASLVVRALLQNAPVQAVPDVLRAYANFHAPDTRALLQACLTDKDVFVRAAAADLLGDLPPDPKTADALAIALGHALNEQPSDAARYILIALAAQHTAFADTAIQPALSASDRVVRSRAADLLYANGAGDFRARVGTFAVRLTDSDYRRAISRHSATATVTTDKGAFTITLLPQDAPLTVDSFIQLAKHGFFNNLTFHRVVPDFVVQGGDPRGDGNGGPGYALRDEFNTVPYGRGTVGMALDGPDTGGSQWFVTHAPQPHLDGHYTVFGQVTQGMSVVDRLARGDRIRAVRITERVGDAGVGYTDAHTFQK